jgi:phage-related tail fiber protein
MKYWQPFGISDPNAPYINGDPTIGRAGSIPPAGAFEQPQRELVNLISYSNINPSDAAVDQVMHAVRSQYINYAVADPSTNENTLTVNFNPAIGSTAVNGMPLRVKAAKTNTGPCQLVVDGVASPLRRADTAELEANDLRASTIFECIWNDTFWAMTNYHGLGGLGSTVNNYVTKIPYTVDTSTTVNAILAAYTPAITTLAPGDAVEVKLKNTVSGPTTIKVNALAPIAVVRGDGSALKPNDAMINQVMLLIYTDANNFQFNGIIPSSSAGFGLPPGCIVLALGSVAIPGTLKLNGALLQRAQHPQLWAYANNSARIVDDGTWQATGSRAWTSFSTGDGAATFRLPEFRGEFLRFFDDGRGVDINRLLTTQQDQQVGAINATGTFGLNNIAWGPWLDENHQPWFPQVHPIVGNGTGGYTNGFITSTANEPIAMQMSGLNLPTAMSGNLSLNINPGLENRVRNTPVVACIVDG